MQWQSVKDIEPNTLALFVVHGDICPTHAIGHINDSGIFIENNKPTTNYSVSDFVIGMQLDDTLWSQYQYPTQCFRSKHPLYASTHDAHNVLLGFNENIVIYDDFGGMYVLNEYLPESDPDSDERIIVHSIANPTHPDFSGSTDSNVSINVIHYRYYRYTTAEECLDRIGVPRKHKDPTSKSIRLTTSWSIYVPLKSDPTIRVQRGDSTCCHAHCRFNCDNTNRTCGLGARESVGTNTWSRSPRCLMEYGG